MNPTRINGFGLYTTEPNTIAPNSYVFTKTIFFNTKNSFKDRLIRVYLPSNYEFDNVKKKYPVIYMMDGKNLFDDYTSFVGEWGIDETVELFIRRKICDGYIVVGVDAPNTNKARTLEMSFDDIPTKSQYSKGLGYANVLAKYIFDVVKPEIDKTFHTLKDRDNTFVGGSSMGGLMAYYLASHHGEKIKAALCFSPAFFLLNQTMLKSFLKSTIDKELPNMFFYVGGVGFESNFVETTEMVYKFYKENRSDLKLNYIYDPQMEHNEYAWRTYFPNALNFIQK